MSDRKYRHKGYQDSGSGSDSRSGPRQGPPSEPRRERFEGAPRGRTTGGFGPAVFKCQKCGNVQRFPEGVAVDAVCGGCGADLHTCSHCKNFDTSTRWECRESMNIPARISPKDVRNLCELYVSKIVRDLSADKGQARVSTPDDARKAFDDLFKK